MTGSTATRMPDATGTRFDPKPGRPFNAREQGRADIDFIQLRIVGAAQRKVQRALNEELLHEIALDRLSEGILDDADIRYAWEVLHAVLDDTKERGAFAEWDHYDILMNAFDIAVERAAHVVAAAWLRERGSIPIPTE